MKKIIHLFRLAQS